MKSCPYCAEEIQDAAIVCKHCSMVLDAGAVKRVAEGSTDPVESDQSVERKSESRPEWESLPQGYSPPGEHISAIRAAEERELLNGEWLEAAIPTRPPKRMKPKKYAEFQKQIAERAWTEGGQTPEGAEKWLRDYLVAERNPDKSGAAHSAMLAFHQRTRSRLTERYVDMLNRVLRQLMNSAFGKNEILEHLEHSELFGEHMVHPAYRPYLIEEAKRYVRSLPEFGSQKLAPAPNPQDYDRVVTKVAALLEKGEITPDLRKHGYAGVVSEEQLHQAIELMIEGDPKFTRKGDRALISLRLRDELKERNVLVGTESWLRDSGYR